MPLYAYKCLSCGSKIEEIQKFSDPPLQKCECGGALEKVFGAPAFHLKGGGWYRDGYGAAKRGGADVAKATKEKLIKDSG